ncbi:MAG: thioredoxin domain-containing protein [Alphaproteobacteria bacterium]|nr:thioredoxin domain-containing protein [Alphaproteobacteria bacterium]
MIWTILILVVAIALFLFGGKMLGKSGKGESMLQKCINLIAIVLVAGCVARLYTPYYFTSVNPMILQDMANGLQEQQAAEKNKAIREAVKNGADAMMQDAPILGNVNAEKTIFVWTDFSCPFCRRVHGELDRVLKERDDVRIVVKNFSIHGELSDAPARAVIAAKIQDNAKAAALVEALMTHEYFSQDDMKDRSKLGDKVKASVLKFAKEAGLDTKKLEEDMKGEVVSRELANVRGMAQEFEINGTPFLIINGQAFPGAIPYAHIVEALDK